MAKLVWDKVGERYYETGVDHGVLYPMADGAYTKGVAWNGLTAITESSTGGEPNPQYADNIKYLNLTSTEEFGGTIEAFTYPVEWEQCDGSAVSATAPGVIVTQQNRAMFGLCYRTKIGNDTEGVDKGYKIHLVYGATASPSEKNRATISDNPDPVTFSWEFTTTPVAVKGMRPTAHLVIDSTKVAPETLKALEDALYGKDEVEPSEAKLPLPDEVITMLTPAG